MYLNFIDFDLEIFLKLNLGTVDNSEDEKVHSLTERSLSQLLGNANLKYLQLNFSYQNIFNNSLKTEFPKNSTID